ncbi:uncharacterized protein LOC143290780 [Babylonia areolata]|uniref:uncharacterized protein LOC143290780 n=1 Tax=Babylonia areolata TaxID=304850 RepID=UPI003FD41B4E
MASSWQRHLLAVARELEEDGEERAVTLTPQTLVLAVAVLVLLLLLVLQCACKENSSSGQGKEGKAAKRNGASSQTANAADYPVVVDIPAEGEPTPSTLPGETSPVSNGGVHSGRNGISPSGHSRNASSGSGQMRPTSLRELPDLPVASSHKHNLSGAGCGDSSGAAHAAVDEKEEDVGGYDHLGVSITANDSAAINYDHIHLESPRDMSSGTTPQSEPDTASEGHYAQVRERTYDVVKDVRARTSAKVMTSSDFDPYAKVKDEEDDKEDTYAKVKDTEKEDADGDYSHLKNGHVMVTSMENSANIKSTLEDEDPYERVIGDSGGAQVVMSAAIPDTDDPYSVVSDQASATVITFSGGGASPHKNRTSSSWNNPTSADAEASYRLQYADADADTQDDYATVVKDRNPSTSRLEGEGGGGEELEEIDPYFTTPPEPPRLYGENEVERLFQVEGQEEASRTVSREHRYSKVTARESLASMSARNALNTYEIVPDLPENTYATVDGGSGDGVVRYATPGAPNLQLNFNEISETYAEIGASGSGSYAVPAPEPPSLDSLHSMTKSTSSNDGDHGNSRPPTSPTGNVVIADDGYAVVSKSGFSPSETALPQIPRAGTSSSIGSVGSVGEERMIGGVTLHADYHSVRDCLPDQDNENDPNYESVDEALSKSPGGSALPRSPAGSALSKSPGGSALPRSLAGSALSKSPGGSALPRSAASVASAAASAVMPVHTSSTTASVPCVTVINHTHSPARVHHQYEEVSPPSSPLASPTGPASTRVPNGAAASNGLTVNGASSSGDTPKGDKSENVETAEVRDRVLQGHMYEDICEVKKRNSRASANSDRGKQQSSDSAKQQSRDSGIQSVKL